MQLSWVVDKARPVCSVKEMAPETGWQSNEKQCLVDSQRNFRQPTHLWEAPQTASSPADGRRAVGS
jgi:hypothetical protein